MHVITKDFCLFYATYFVFYTHRIVWQHIVCKIYCVYKDFPIAKMAFWINQIRITLEECEVIKSSAIFLFLFC